jgi:very-short-patch-repair endonuclease
VYASTRDALNKLAAAQRGLFSSAQAAAIGMRYAQLSRAEAAGQLRRVRRGVYAVAGAPRSQWEDIVAAALAAGPEAVVSHQSAAAVHGFEFAERRSVELSVPAGSRSRLTGIVLHRVTDLSARDIIERRGVLVTTPCRTLVDLAGRLGPVLTEKTLDEGLVQRRWTVSDLVECLARARQNAPGRTWLESCLHFRSEDTNADSVLEARVFRALSGVVPFAAHYSIVIGGSVYVVDGAWPERMVAMEIAGRSHRLASRSAFDRERDKFNALGSAGWRIVHLTSTMSNAEMVALVRRALEVPGGPTGGPLAG